MKLMEKKEYPYLSAFIRITQAISSSLNMEEVLHLIVKSTCETTGSKGCAVLLLNERGGRLEIKSSCGLSDSYIQKGPLAADRSISEALNGKPVVIEDATSDPKIQYPQEAKEEGIASIASFPILLREKVIGILRLYTSVPCRFTEDDIDFLSAIALQSGLAIENARMYELIKGDYQKLMTSLHSRTG
jgi:GAF domain-containing protein